MTNWQFSNFKDRVAYGLQTLILEKSTPYQPTILNSYNLETDCATLYFLCVSNTNG